MNDLNLLEEPITQAEKYKLDFPGRQNHITIKNRIWFLKVSALQRQPFIFPGWSAPEVFGNDNPVYIEYCSGNGAWIAAKAEQNPSINWVAVEYKFSRVCKIWGQLKRRNLPNLFVINGEAYEATSLYFENSSVDGVFINFPDPWPKRKHEKYRLISNKFASQLARIVKPKGTLTLATDDTGYSKWSIDIMNKQNEFTSSYPFPYYTNEWPDYGDSFFDSLWRSKGRSIFYHNFIRG